MWILLWLIIAIWFPFLTGCPSQQYLKAQKANSMENQTSSPKYFGSWKSYQIPFIPEEPIIKEEAKKRKAYYVGYYNQQNQLEQFEKYLDGNLEWRDEYTYWENGKLKKRLMVKSDGSKIQQDFDRNGNIIR